METNARATPALRSKKTVPGERGRARGSVFVLLTMVFILYRGITTAGRARLPNEAGTTLYV